MEWKGREQRKGMIHCAWSEAGAGVLGEKVREEAERVRQHKAS